MLAVLPEAGEAVCRGLRFRPEQRVVSFLSDKPLSLVRSWIGDTVTLVHMLPLTFNAFCDGPILLSPPNREAAELFGHIGTVTELDSCAQPRLLVLLPRFTVCLAN